MQSTEKLIECETKMFFWQRVVQLEKSVSTAHKAHATKKIIKLKIHLGDHPPDANKTHIRFNTPRLPKCKLNMSKNSTTNF